MYLHLPTQRLVFHCHHCFLLLYHYHTRLASSWKLESFPPLTSLIGILSPRKTGTSSTHCRPLLSVPSFPTVGMRRQSSILARILTRRTFWGETPHTAFHRKAQHYTLRTLATFPNGEGRRTEHSTPQQWYVCACLLAPLYAGKEGKGFRR